MLKIPEEDIIAKIKSKTGMSEEEINSKIEVKMSQLAGLISREGALHILANENGVKLVNMEEKPKIRNLFVGMRNIEVSGKATAVYEVREFQTQNRSGKVGSFMLGDETGKIRVVLWGSKADELNKLKIDDVVRVKGAYVKENQSRKELHLGDNAKFEINPEGVSVGEVKQMSFTRKNINELQEADNEVELLSTIVQVYNPTFYEVCPECGKRVKQLDGSYNCPQHGNVEPAYSYVLNVFLDDGTGNIRAVFFRNQVEKLLEKSREELLQYRTNAQEFEKVKHDMLGKMIKVMGRATKNMMFDRLEFTAQLVFPNPDPTVEIKRLKGEEVGEELSIGQMNELNKTKPVEEKPAEPQQQVVDEKPAVQEQTAPVEEKPIGEELVQEIAKTIAEEKPVVEEIKPEPVQEQPQEANDSADVKDIEKELESETVKEPVQETSVEKSVVEEATPAAPVEEAVLLDDLPPVEDVDEDPAEEDKDSF